ncbi:hypothetical protein HY844_02615 [Candidatus Berkelbacteria bacterium]|nr:hypothetical protein [Candidatus Berkelbacteria bacterium]
MRKLILIIALVFSFSLILIVPTQINAQPADSSQQDSLEKKCSDSRPTSVTVRNCTLAERITDPTGFVAPSWAAIRSSINILLLLALLVISFTNILRINLNSYEVKKALPNLVVGVILANASFLIIRYMADIATVTVYFFVERAGETTLSGFVSRALSGLTDDTIGVIGTAVADTAIVSTIVLFVFTIILVIGLLWLAAILYARLVVIYLLTILAPLAFVSYGIPGFDKYFKQWWQLFIKWMFMLPAMAAIFWIMISVDKASTSGEYSLAKTIILFFLLFFAVSLPTKLGGSIAEKVGKGFNKYTGLDAARKGITESTKREGNILLNRTPYGNLKAFMDKNTALREEKLKAIQQKKVNWAENTFLGKQQAHNDEEIGTLKSDFDKIKASNMGVYYESKKGKEALKEAVEAEIEKKMAETNRDNLKLQLKIDLQGEQGALEGKTKQLRESIFKNKSYTDEIELSENIGVGNIAFNSVEILKTIDEAKKIDKELQREDLTQERRNELEESLEIHRQNFNHLKKLDEHSSEFGGIGNLDDAVKILKDKTQSRSRIWTATLGRAKKIVNKSIDAQNEDMIENGSAEDITAMLDDYIKKIDENFVEAVDRENAKKLFISGQYATFQKLIDEKAKKNDKGKIDIGLRDGLLAMHAQKKIISKTNDYRHKEVLLNILEVNNSLDAENKIDLARINPDSREGAKELSRIVTSRIGSMTKTPSDKIRTNSKKSGLAQISDGQGVLPLEDEEDEDEDNGQ